MKKLVLLLGLVMVGGAVFVMNDISKKQYAAGDTPLDMDAYWADLQPRAMEFAQDLGPMLAALPGKARETTVAFFSDDGPQKVKQTNRLGALQDRSKPRSLSGGAGSTSITGFGTRTGDTEDAAKAIGEMMDNAQAGKF